MVRRLRERVQARNAKPENDFAVSFSLGIARYDPEEPCSLQDLLALADKRMYQDKTAKKAAAAMA
jgi:GGDEF domain-containing protein